MHQDDRDGGLRHLKTGQGVRLCYSLVHIVDSDLGWQGEAEHRRSKDRYDRSNGQDVSEDLSKLECRERTIQVIGSELSESTNLQVVPTRSIKKLIKKNQRLLNNDPAPEDISLQYNVGKSENSPIDLGTFLSRNAGDPAITVRVTVLCTSCQRCSHISPTLRAFTRN